MINKELQTPCYIIHKDILEDGIELLKGALDRDWKNSCVGYSFKTNSLPWVVEKMKQEDFYAEVVSENEYDLACKHNFEHIIYNGPVKGKRTFSMPWSMVLLLIWMLKESWIGWKKVGKKM